MNLKHYPKLKTNQSQLCTRSINKYILLRKGNKTKIEFSEQWGIIHESCRDIVRVLDFTIIQNTSNNF